MKQEGFGRRVFNVINICVLILVSLCILLPFLHVVGSSFASSVELLENPFLIIPKAPTLSTYKYIFSTNTLLSSLRVSITVTLVGTIVNLTLTVMTAYPLAHRSLAGRSLFMNAIIFTMLFSGGMIPGFMLVKNLGLIDSLWALIFPGAISTFNLIVVKNFFQQIPFELEEAAKIDGANELVCLARVILPLSLPILATMTLFYAVAHWNNYFGYLLYINDSNKYNVQVLLRQIVIMSAGIGDGSSVGEAMVIPSEGVKMATIVVSTVPILIVYPFLQKYFTSGLMLGSVKG